MTEQHISFSDDYPVRLIDALKKLFAGFTGIRSAYIAGIYSPGSTSPPSRPIIGVDVAGDMAEFIEKISGALKASGLTDIPYYLHIMGDDIISQYMHTTEAFYMKASRQEAAREKIGEIEREMKKIGYWQQKPLPPEAYDFTQAFAMDTMAYSQWLQFIFLPRVQKLIESNGEFPSSSNVGTQALREFDGNWDADTLVSLLCEFDRIIEA